MPKEKPLGAAGVVAAVGSAGFGAPKLKEVAGAAAVGAGEDDAAVSAGLAPKLKVDAGAAPKDGAAG